VIRAGPAARDAAPAPPAAPAVVAVWVPPLAGAARPDARAARVGLRARLATAIEALPEVRTIDGAASTVPGTGWRELSTAELRTRARRLGARYVAGAAVVRGPSGDELSVDLYAVDDGARLLRAVEPLAGRHPDEAVGRLGWQVVREAAARDRFLAASRRFLMGGTSSAFALAHLVQGQRKFRDANFAGAAADFERAIAADSNCAPAYHRLSVTRVWQHDFPAALAVIEAGLARRARAPADWVRLMEAQREYARRDGERAIALFQRSVVDAPANVDGWFGLSEALFHFGWFTGHDSADASGRSRNSSSSTARSRRSTTTSSTSRSTAATRRARAAPSRACGPTTGSGRRGTPCSPCSSARPRGVPARCAIYRTRTGGRSPSWPPCCR
jgi:hypothetical protein